MSDQDNSIFDKEVVEPVGNDQKPTETPVQNKSYDDILAMIVKEDGSPKYSSVEQALRSVPHAQTHISQLEKELADLRAEVERRKTAEEVLENFKSKETVEKPSAPSVDIKDIDSLLERKLVQKEQERIFSSNIEQVKTAISSVYGDKANDVYISAANEAGISIAEMNRLAASSPNAVFKLIGLDKQPQHIPAKSSSTVNTDVFASKPSEKVVSAKLSGTTSNDLLASWRNAGTIVKQKLGVNE